MADDTPQKLTHLDAHGEAHMVDISGKSATVREAVATATLSGSIEVIAALMTGTQKGDALATARIAGIMATKKTSELIPLCHPIPINKVSITIKQVEDRAIGISATVRTNGQTGVEMEALTAASVAALTLYDMGKALDKSMVISEVKLQAKSGGKSGDYHRGPGA